LIERVEKSTALLSVFCSVCSRSEAKWCQIEQLGG